MPAVGSLGRTVRHLPNCVALTWPACNVGRDRYLKNQPMGDIDGLSSQAFEGSVAGRINGAKKCGT